MGGSSSSCHGNHPGEISQKKDVITNQSTYMHIRASEFQGIIDSYLQSINVLNQDIEIIKSWFSVKIPNQIKAIADARQSQINLKEQLLKNAINRRDNRKRELDAKLIELDGKRGQYKDITTTTNKISDYISDIQGGIVSSETYIQKMYSSLYSSIQSENNVIVNSLNTNSDRYSADNSKIENKDTVTTNLLLVKFGLYILYYLLVFFGIYLLYNSSISRFSKIAIVAILLLYPLYIYSIQYRSQIAWNTIYSRLRGSGPDN